MAKNYHVVPDPKGGWNVKGAGATRSSAHTDTQKEAISRGRDLSIKSGGELNIHGTDGRIREKSSYGNDPHPPKG
jgi:hypothetical protein